LQDKSLVDSIPDPAHGRRNIISVSEAGARVAPALDALAEELGQDLEAGLTGLEKLQLCNALLKVIANLNAPSRSAAPAASAARD
jgi:DNA-binding MarR family transcriptional regulator